MTCTPVELATLLDEDVNTQRAVLVLNAATAVVSAVTDQHLPPDVAHAAVLALAARVYGNPIELADWDQASALITAELAALPTLERSLARVAVPEPIAMPLLLGKLTPEAKRELASQLLRSASTDEGYSEDAQDGTMGA